MNRKTFFKMLGLGSVTASLGVKKVKAVDLKDLKGRGWYAQRETIPPISVKTGIVSMDSYGNRTWTVINQP